MLIQSNSITLFNAAYKEMPSQGKKPLESIHGILNMDATESDLYTISYIFLILNLIPTAIKSKIPPHVISFLKKIENDLIRTQKTLLENIYSNDEVDDERISNILLGNAKTFAKYDGLISALDKGVGENHSVKKEEDKIIFRAGDNLIGKFEIPKPVTRKIRDLRFFSPAKPRTPTKVKTTIQKSKSKKEALKQALKEERKQSRLGKKVMH